VSVSVSVSVSVREREREREREGGCREIQEGKRETSLLCLLKT